VPCSRLERVPGLRRGKENQAREDGDRFNSSELDTAIKLSDIFLGFTSNDSDINSWYKADNGVFAGEGRSCKGTAEKSRPYNVGLARSSGGGATLWSLG
jgi:hypothetical protein